MWSFLKRRVCSEKGAMDKIIVTLLLVVVGVAATVGLATWADTQNTTTQTAATGRITAVTTEAAGL